MAGIRLASTDGQGWTVETVVLEATGRRRGAVTCGTDPLGDGPQLLVRRHGRVVAYCAGLDDVEGLGVDMAAMAVVARWLASSAATLALTGRTSPRRPGSYGA